MTMTLTNMKWRMRWRWFTTNGGFLLWLLAFVVYFLAVFLPLLPFALIHMHLFNNGVCPKWYEKWILGLLMSHIETFFDWLGFKK